MTAKADSRYQIALQFAARTRWRAPTAALKNTYAASVTAVAANTPNAISGWTARFMVTFMMAGPSFDRQRIDRRADRTGDRDGRRDEQKLIGLVGGAILAQFLQLENLAHGHPHDRNGDPVPGLVDALLALVRAHLATPCIGRERGKLGALDPLQSLEGEA